MESVLTDHVAMSSAPCSSNTDDRLVSSKRKSSVNSSESGNGKRQAITPKQCVPGTDTDDEYFNDEMSDIDEETISKMLRQFHSLPKVGQKATLTQLIGCCSLPLVRHVKQLIEPHFQKDFLACLPAELSIKIVSCMSPSDIIRAARVSHHWRMMCEDDRLWRSKCEIENITALPPPSRRSTGAWKMPAPRCGVNVIDHVPDEELEKYRKERLEPYGCVYERSKYKSLYLRTQRISSNWRKLPIAGSCLLRGHEEHVITCLQISGDIIVTGSDDNSLKVWNAEKGELMFTLVGHAGGVWTSQVSADGKYVVSGSTDRTVKVWSTVDGMLVHTLLGHTSTVRCMSLCGTTLVSGSRDTHLRIWDIVSGVCKQVLSGHVAAVRCVQFDGRRVVSGAYDFNVKVWRLNGECIHTLTGHTNRVYSLLLDSERNIVVSGSLDTTIRVWDIETGECKAQLQGHQSLTSGMQLRGDILVSCNADSDVRVWNIKDGRCVYRLNGPNGHRSAITSLQFLDNGLVATSSDDGTVKLWDVRKGVFVRDLIRLESGGRGGCIWRLKATDSLLACAVGSRNFTEDTKLVLLDFDACNP